MIDFDEMLNVRLNETDPLQAWYWLERTESHARLRSAFDEALAQVENTRALNMERDFNFYSACYCSVFVEFLHNNGEI